ncbi:hypothetical protein L6164_006476 [Bauhinia variegata]|uniref:Uncharacterized protein n=1 Tax=Bauhinia variegata TaxID=167791 RepID=A0ACB9PWM9_BAUVA|nr:hypothetical protein L6164_006476 [Bauhinia variegata]
MPATMLFSLVPHVSANLQITYLPNKSTFSSITNSSSLVPDPPKSFKQNHASNSLSIASTTNPNIGVSSDPKSHSDATIKMPTAPWMMGRLLLQPQQVLDLSNPNADKSFSKDEAERERSNKALTKKESGVRGKKAMKKIVESVQKLQKGQDSTETHMGRGKFEFGDCWGPLREEQEYRNQEKMPWVQDDRIVFRRMKKKVVTAADLTLDKVVLWRLRNEAARLRRWTKVKKAGVTQDVVQEIKRTWKRNELAMVKFDVPLCRNMDRAREIVETKTGGLVVWSKKDILVVYRGCNSQLTSEASPFHNQKAPSNEINQLEAETGDDISSYKSNGSSKTEMLSWEPGHDDSVAADTHYKEYMNCQPVHGSLYEREADRLLDGLGPRFIDWWMHKPLPVDGDLLPEVVPGFKLPFRLSPPHDGAKLTDTELAYLRKLAKLLPTHFVLGRNRRVQGLAAAILKLWEKSLIAKIAVKYGVPNTHNETMANELKSLTGGVLLLRNKYFIILYRGKDFLPGRVATLIENREVELRSFQLQEEVARLTATEAFPVIDEPSENTSTSGTLTEFKEIQRMLRDNEMVKPEYKVELEAEKERLKKELRKEMRKAFILKKKKERSARELSKLNAAWTPAEQDADLEIMTEEERECFRKIGLKMNSCLVLGRRGIFSGVVEGLHQHWKHREVVKVITMQRAFKQVIYTAKLLEAESGGILVSIDKLKEGHAIIIYRGKNYRRPSKQAAKNLLTKREALSRSLEMQRIGSLKFFANQKQQKISDLKQKLADLQQGIEIEQTKIDN